MDNLMNNSLTGKVAEKGLDNQVGKDTCCPDLGFKVRVISFLGMFIFGKCVDNLIFLDVLKLDFSL